MVIAISNVLLPLLLLLMPLLLLSPQSYWCYCFCCLLLTLKLLLLPLPIPSLSLPSLPVTSWLLLLSIIFFDLYCTHARAAATAYCCCCCLMLLVVPQYCQCHCRYYLWLLPELLTPGWLYFLHCLLQSFLSWLFFCCQYFAATAFCLLHDDLANATYTVTMTTSWWLPLWLLPCCCHHLCHSLLAATMFLMFLVACCCNCYCMLVDCNVISMPGLPIHFWSIFPWKIHHFAIAVAGLLQMQLLLCASYIRLISSLCGTVLF